MKMLIISKKFEQTAICKCEVEVHKQWNPLASYHRFCDSARDRSILNYAQLKAGSKSAFQCSSF